MNQHMIQTRIPQLFNYKAKPLACSGSTNVKNEVQYCQVVILFWLNCFTLIYIYYFTPHFNT